MCLYFSHDSNSSVTGEICSEGSKLNTLLAAAKRSAVRSILQHGRVVKFYLEKSVHGGFCLQCVHVYKHNRDKDRELTEGRQKCYPLLKTGQEGQYKLLQCSV